MRTSLNVPDDLLSEFDEVWQAEGLASRSRAVRQAMEAYIRSHAELESATGTVVAVVAYEYDHETVVDEVYHVQHEFDDVITATTHVHQGPTCLETVICDGPAETVRDLVYHLRDFDAVRNTSLLSLSTH
jgi:CopG family nickel-responsive transcriptional regulator